MERWGGGVTDADMVKGRECGPEEVWAVSVRVTVQAWVDPPFHDLHGIAKARWEAVPDGVVKVIAKLEVRGRNSFRLSVVRVDVLGVYRGFGRSRRLWGELECNAVLVLVLAVRLLVEVRGGCWRVARQAMVILYAHVELDVHVLRADLDWRGAVDRDLGVVCQVI